MGRYTRKGTSPCLRPLLGRFVRSLARSLASRELLAAERNGRTDGLVVAVERIARPAGTFRIQPSPIIARVSLIAGEGIV